MAHSVSWNYQCALMKPYFDASLKDLARASGYPTEAIQSCSKFKRTRFLLLETWEALFKIIVNCQVHAVVSSSKTEVKDAFPQVNTCTNDRLQLNQIISRLYSIYLTPDITHSFRLSLKIWRRQNALE